MPAKTNQWLLAVENLDQSWAMVAYFSRLCRPENQRVVLFHVELPAPDAYFDLEHSNDPIADFSVFRAWRKSNRRKTEAFLESARQVFIDAGFKADDVLIRSSKMVKGIARDILEESAKDYVGLCMGRSETHDRNDTNLGSVTTKLVNKCAHTSVMVVGGKPNPDKVLIGVDRSDGAQRCIDLFSRSVSNTQIDIALVHVFRSLKISLDPRLAAEDRQPMFPVETELAWQTRHKKTLRSKLESMSRQLQAAGWPANRISKQIIQDADERSRTLVEEARRTHRETIIVGRRGTSFVKEFFLGRVGQKILNQAHDHAVWIVA